MPGRVVVQWDKGRLRRYGIIKVDLLALGMMAVLEDTLKWRPKWTWDSFARTTGRYAALPEGRHHRMFQVESRAQMSSLPRMRPVCFYESWCRWPSSVRGPLFGKMVHPYLNRRQGRGEAGCLHPSLEPCCAGLSRPIFPGTVAAPWR